MKTEDYQGNTIENFHLGLNVHYSIRQLRLLWTHRFDLNTNLCYIFFYRENCNLVYPLRRYSFNLGIKNGPRD
jgi:hypothetical protein